MDYSAQVTDIWDPDPIQTQNRLCLSAVLVLILALSSFCNHPFFLEECPNFFLILGLEGLQSDYQ